MFCYVARTLYIFYHFHILLEGSKRLVCRVKRSVSHATKCARLQTFMEVIGVFIYLKNYLEYKHFNMQIYTDICDVFAVF